MYRILWASPFALHDSSSGAAIQCRNMLEYLLQYYGREIEVKVLCAMMFDDPKGSVYFKNINELQSGKEGIFKFKENGIDYTYTVNRCLVRRGHTAQEQDVYFGEYVRLLKSYRPDLVIGYGTCMLSMSVRFEAGYRGIPVVYCLWNPTHKSYTFPCCDRIVTDSHATARFYIENFGINVLPAGIFINPQSVVAPKKDRKPQYVTFVNPSSYKGLGIFARLALMAKEQLPEVKFLVVESRGSFAKNLEKMYELGPDGKTKNFPLRAEMFTNVDVCQHTDNIKEVYAITKLLFAPSVWYEGWGRVTTEAVMNDIPVLGSKSGGIPEASGENVGASVCLDPPQECLKDWDLIPTAEQIQPWLDKLRDMLGSDYGKYVKNCPQAARQHEPKVSAQRLYEILEPLLARKAGDDSQLFRSGSFYK